MTNMELFNWNYIHTSLAYIQTEINFRIVFTSDNKILFKMLVLRYYVVLNVINFAQI